MFIDLRIMKLTSGAGGNGAVSFFRDNLTTSGPPDGGDGGSGETSISMLSIVI